MQNSVCTNTLITVIVQKGHPCFVQKELKPLCIGQMHIDSDNYSFVHKLL